MTLIPEEVRDLAKPALPLFANAHFVVDACRTCYIPGYLILKPRDAVGSLSQMNPVALASLGLTLAMLTAAIEAIIQPLRVYCVLFSEQTRVVHFHLFPRTKWLTAKYFAAHPNETEISSPKLMDWQGEVFTRQLAAATEMRLWKELKAGLRRVRTRNSARRKTSLPL